MLILVYAFFFGFIMLYILRMPQVTEEQAGCVRKFVLYAREVQQQFLCRTGIMFEVYSDARPR